MKNSNKQVSVGNHPENKITLEDIQKREDAVIRRKAELQKEMEEINRQKLDYIHEQEKSPYWNVIKPYDENIKKYEAMIFLKWQEQCALTPNVTPEELKEAWQPVEEEFRLGMAEEVHNYYEAKRALYEKYVALVNKQKDILKLRDDLEKHYHIEGALPVTIVIPPYDKSTAKFFDSIIRDGDPYMSELYSNSIGIPCDIHPIGNAAVTGQKAWLSIFPSAELAKQMRKYGY